MNFRLSTLFLLIAVYAAGLATQTFVATRTNRWAAAVRGDERCAKCGDSFDWSYRDRTIPTSQPDAVRAWHNTANGYGSTTPLCVACWHECLPAQRAKFVENMFLAEKQKRGYLQDKKFEQVILQDIRSGNGMPDEQSQSLAPYGRKRPLHVGEKELP